jgi:hypothetical protein
MSRNLRLALYRVRATGKGSVQEKRNHYFLAPDIPKFMD